MEFGANKVAIVDTVGVNTVVRGARPLTGDAPEFAYSELAARLSQFGLDLNNSMLIDVCLIDCVGERDEFVPEIEAFGLDPNKWPSTYWPPYLQPDWNPRWLYGVSVKQDGVGHPARFVWWPIQGMSPTDNPDVFLKYPGWDFSGCVDYIKALAVTESGMPSIVYFHCSSGADRTGALHTGYLMKHKKKTLAEASEIADNSTPVGSPNADYCRLRKAYAKMIGELSARNNIRRAWFNP